VQVEVTGADAAVVHYAHEEAARSHGAIAPATQLARLQVARRRARHGIAGDMRALPLRRTFARVTCLYDSLNHLKDRNDLVAAFRETAGAMDRDALLLFDVNHPDVYPAIWGNDQPFIADGNNFHLEMATSYRSRDRIAQAMVTGWADLPSGQRVTIRERREQRAYSEREIINALAAAGLAPIEVTEFVPYAEGSSVKLFFVCGRVGMAAAE